MLILVASNSYIRNCNCNHLDKTNKPCMLHVLVHVKPVADVFKSKPNFVSLFVKAGVPAFTALQQEEAMGSLQKRANELGVICSPYFSTVIWQLASTNHG